MVHFHHLLAASLVFGAVSAEGQSRYRPGSVGPAGGSFGGGFGGGSAFGDAANGGGASGDLSQAIPGTPGADYPIFAEVPETSFLCDGQVDGGYYADVETDCQAFHICANDGQGGLTKYSFLCPNGTLFQQEYFVCDWWFNVDCSVAESLYSLNEQIAAEQAANSPAGGRPEAGGRPGGRPSGGFGGQNGGFGGQTGGFNSAPAGYGSPAGYVRNARELGFSPVSAPVLAGQEPIFVGEEVQTIE